MRDLLARIIASSLHAMFQAQPHLSKFVPQETSDREPSSSLRSRKMNATQRQFSLNRKASKKQFPVSSPEESRIRPAGRGVGRTFGERLGMGILFVCFAFGEWAASNAASLGEAELGGQQPPRNADLGQELRLRVLRSAEDFERSMASFWDQHGYRSFSRNVGDYLVGSPIFRAEPRESKDRHAPRATLLRFIAYAQQRKQDLIPLANALVVYSKLVGTAQTNLPPGLSDAETGRGLRGAFQATYRSGQSVADNQAALAHQRTMLRLHHSVLWWLQLEYGLIIQDSTSALNRPTLLFEQPTDPAWNIAVSPGVFSVLVRGPDLEALETIGRRLLTYPPTNANPGGIEGLLPDRGSFLHQALAAANLGPASNVVRRCLAEACKNPYEVLYWDYALGLFAGQPRGEQLFGGVCRMAARHGISDLGQLYWRVRECAFPDNSECIWPRKKMSRFDSRILDIALRASSPTVVEEMTKIQSEIHARVRRGELRGGGIAEYTKGRLHGMDDFLDHGVGGCEAFSSFVTTPLLSLGNSGVHPVFIARPYQPWGHWIAGAEAAGTLYVCDAESVGFGPPEPVMQNLDRTMRSASPAANRYLNLRVYSQTLASWEWEYLLEGSGVVANIKKTVNPLYAAYRQAVRGIWGKP